MKKFTLFFLIAAAGFLVYNFWPEKEITFPPGILVKENPLQGPVFNKSPWSKNGFSIIPLAEFKIKARVLSKNYYSFDGGSKISPLDLALGWGLMSDQSVIDRLDISQRNRWYHWKTEYLPASSKDISSHSANMHIVPADESIENKFDEVYKGSLIEMTGYLIEIKGEKGWHWKSSLSRDDTGGGACELVWVDDLKIIN
ncbi:MAG TPA: hypothetical protein VMT35_11545 [Ignavibacteriaceae bacterium]|nr:hypothetical protein [Ignavibacteriaceae bacterium]